MITNESTLRLSKMVSRGYGTLHIVNSKMSLLTEIVYGSLRMYKSSLAT